MSLQIIVLLSIMAIWALTSLLSREAQPLPPRPVRGPVPDGTRSSPTARSAAVNPGRYVETGERSSGPARPALARGMGGDDGIVIIETDARGSRPFSGPPSASPSGAAPRNSRGGQIRRGSRGRSSSNANPARPAEPGRSRALTTQVTQSMAQKKNRPLEIAPLDAPPTPFGMPLIHLATATLREQPKSWDVPPAFDSAALRTMLASRDKLREVALLSEILQPPIALRRTRRAKRG